MENRLLGSVSPPGGWLMPCQTVAQAQDKDYAHLGPDLYPTQNRCSDGILSSFTSITLTSSTSDTNFADMWHQQPNNSSGGACVFCSLCCLPLSSHVHLQMLSLSSLSLGITSLMPPFLTHTGEHYTQITNKISYICWACVWMYGYIYVLCKYTFFQSVGFRGLWSV